jgi:hypothetical protein
VEGALQTEDALAAGHIAQARLARRQHGQFHPVQVAADDVLAEQDAPVGRPGWRRSLRWNSSGFFIGLG